MGEAIPKPNHLLMFVPKVEFGINWVIRKGFHRFIHPPSRTLRCFSLELSLVHNWSWAFSHDGFCIFTFWVLLKPTFLMGLVFTKWACAFLLCCCLITSGVYSGKFARLASKFRALSVIYSSKTTCSLHCLTWFVLCWMVLPSGGVTWEF